MDGAKGYSALTMTISGLMSAFVDTSCVTAHTKSYAGVDFVKIFFAKQNLLNFQYLKISEFLTKKCILC